MASKREDHMPKLSIAITGAGSGLGRGAALGLVRRGHRVLACVHYPTQVTELRAEAAENGLALQVEKVDLLRASDRDWLGRQEIDVLVNNAALSETGPIAEQPLELVREVFETNVFATLALTQDVARAMVARGRGRIVFMSSMAGLMSIPYVGAYCASKHALEAIAACMHTELAPHGVAVMTFQPGPYKTGFNDRMWDTHGRWLDASRNFTRASDMAGTAAILDTQFDPEEAIAAFIAAIEAETPRYRNVVPQAIEDAVKASQQEAWTRRL
jgi:short-subunit dehydrogenase